MKRPAGRAGNAPAHSRCSGAPPAPRRWGRVFPSGDRTRTHSPPTKPGGPASPRPTPGVISPRLLVVSTGRQESAGEFAGSLLRANRSLWEHMNKRRNQTPGQRRGQAGVSNGRE